MKHCSAGAKAAAAFIEPAAIDCNSPGRTFSNGVTVASFPTNLFKAIFLSNPVVCSTMELLATSTSVSSCSVTVYRCVSLLYRCTTPSCLLAHTTTFVCGARGVLGEVNELILSENTCGTLILLLSRLYSVRYF